MNLLKHQADLLKRVASRLKWSINNVKDIIVDDEIAETIALARHLANLTFLVLEHPNSPLNRTAGKAGSEQDTTQPPAAG